MTAQDLVLAGSYDYRLVAVSVLIAIKFAFSSGVIVIPAAKDCTEDEGGGDLA